MGKRCVAYVSKDRGNDKGDDHRFRFIHHSSHRNEDIRTWKGRRQRVDSRECTQSFVVKTMYDEVRRFEQVSTLWKSRQ
jgi:hypothetical protein